MNDKYTKDDRQKTEEKRSKDKLRQDDNHLHDDKRRQNDKRRQESVIRETLTYEDYYNMPEDGKRYELAEGVLQLMSPGPNTRHQRVLKKFHLSFEESCAQEGEILFAPIDVILSAIDVRQPDLVFIVQERLSIITERGIEGAPDLIVEILSPSTAHTDKQAKRRTYAKYGVKEYWLADPSYNLIEQLVLVKDKYQVHKVYGAEEIVTSPQFPCIHIPVNDIFPEDKNR